VLLTLGAVALVVLVVGGGVGGYLAYQRQVDRANDARDASRVWERRADSAGAQVRKLYEQLAAARNRASDEYLRGLREGREDERTSNAEFGLDDDGGYNDAFAGFGGWQTDAHYIVLVTKGEKKLKYNIESRIDMQPCTLYLVEGSSIFTRDDPAC
jgi:hypothetical protein